MNDKQLRQQRIRMLPFERKIPYAPEIVLKTQVVRIFSAAGVPIDLDDLPESPLKLPAPQLSRDQQQWDFFLAYPGIDRPTANRIHAALAERGYRAFLDHVDVTPGEGWTEALPEASSATTLGRDAHPPSPNGPDARLARPGRSKARHPSESMVTNAWDSPGPVSLLTSGSTVRLW